MNAAPDETDLARLRRAIALSRAALDAGDLPFGAAIVGADGTTLAEATSTELSEGDWTCHAETNAVAEATSTELSEGDWTCHAETNAVRLAATAHPRATLAGATIYASAEPCAMCASAIFYAGIRRVIYAFGEPRLRALLARRADTVGIGYSCREVFARAAAPVQVAGPLLEDEAAIPQATYWDSR